MLSILRPIYFKLTQHLNIRHLVRKYRHTNALRSALHCRIVECHRVIEVEGKAMAIRISARAERSLAPET
jgi:hypothetical protein